MLGLAELNFFVEVVAEEGLLFFMDEIELECLLELSDFSVRFLPSSVKSLVSFF